MDKITAKADMEAAWSTFEAEWRTLKSLASGTPAWTAQYDKCAQLRTEGDNKTARYQSILRREWIAKQSGADLD